VGKKKWIEGDWIYDLECYPNVFTFCVMYANGSGIRVFEVSHRKNEVDKILAFLRKVVAHKHRMVGFNNVGFDYVLLHDAILVKASECLQTGNPLTVTPEEIYAVMLDIFESKKDGGFGKTIKNPWIPQVDLFKIHHFDNKARATSLKMLEFNMRSENIEDLPFPPGTVLTDEQIDVLISYNKHDVSETRKFYMESVGAIQFRESLTERYGFDCTNLNDTKIGKEYFINRLEKAMPGCCYKVTPHGRKMMQTRRKKIAIKDVIFPYVEFKRPEFNAVKRWFMSQVITETKGVFSDIREDRLGDVAAYADMRVVKKKWKTTPSESDVASALKENPKAWVDVVDLKSKKGAQSHWLCWREADTLNVLVDGFRFDFGTGGIHGSVDSTIVRSDDEYEIIDADVSSMYPNIAIANRVYPKHLSDEFCNIYEDVYHERKKYPKSDPANLIMKLALNGVYGDSNNQYSPFFDAQYTMAITINGQLSLCMLAERLIEIEGCSLVQVNTDGVTVRIPRNKRTEYDAVCAQWQVDVGLQLEYAFYDAMFIRDVNNYIAVYTDGKVKRKGSYEYENLGWHQNHSALVIQMAVEHELLGRGSAESFIVLHDNEYDFMLRTKVNRSSSLVIVGEDGVDVPVQNICRYYPCKDGGKLVKIMPPLKDGDELRRLSIDKEWNVRVCNNMLDFDWKVDYDYYIQEARKLIDCLTGNKDKTA